MAIVPGCAISLSQPEVISGICNDLLNKGDMYSLKQCLLVNSLWFHEATRCLWRNLSIEAVERITELQNDGRLDLATSGRAGDYGSAIQHIRVPSTYEIGDMSLLNLRAVKSLDLSQCHDQEAVRELLRKAMGPALERVLFDILQVDEDILSDLTRKFPHVELLCTIDEPDFQELVPRGDTESKKASQLRRLISEKYRWRVWDIHFDPSDESIPSWILADILKNPSLQEVILVYGMTVPPAIDHLLRSTISLAHIKKAKFTLYYDMNEELYTRLTGLECLTVNGDMTDMTNFPLIVAESCPRLKHIILERFEKLAVSALGELLRKCRIESFFLNIAEGELPESSLLSLIEKAHHLLDLRIRVYSIESADSRITMMQAIADNCPKLKILKLKVAGWGRGFMKSPERDDNPFENLEILKLEFLPVLRRRRTKKHKSVILPQRTLEYIRPMGRVTWHPHDADQFDPLPVVTWTWEMVDLVVNQRSPIKLEQDLTDDDWGGTPLMIPGPLELSPV